MQKVVIKQDQLVYLIFKRGWKAIIEREDKFSRDTLLAGRMLSEAVQSQIGQTVSQQVTRGICGLEDWRWRFACNALPTTRQFILQIIIVCRGW